MKKIFLLLFMICGCKTVTQPTYNPNYGPDLPVYRPQIILSIQEEPRTITIISVTTYPCVTLCNPQPEVLPPPMPYFFPASLPQKLDESYRHDIIRDIERKRRSLYLETEKAKKAHSLFN